MLLLCPCVAAGWMHFLIGLFIACFFSPLARYVTLGLWLTVLLPAKPVLWNAFCRWAARSYQHSAAPAAAHVQ
jgi:hypothetical protein